MKQQDVFALTALALWMTMSIATGAPAERGVPKPLADHPGNVFLAGEEVSVALPSPNSAWRLLDYEKNVVAEGSAVDRKVALGKLPVGYYVLHRLTNGALEPARVTVGVVAPLSAPTPKTSPIGIDVAMAWFYTNADQQNSANLCALAGVNWVRDRLMWNEMEPRRGQFSAPNRYDDTARKQADAGLQVLQVIHVSPPWANPDTKRFPLDLRDAYHFMREMAQRWNGEVTAFEPWNEADIHDFGGHSGMEMASLQKASYLGLKDGNPQIIACQNVFALPGSGTLLDLDANHAWPYFDTFNLHHYVPADAYPGVYQAFRNVSAGKPMWVTEFNAPVHWTGDAKEQEPTDADLQIQSERVAQVFAASLHERPAVAFYFILPHFCEGQTQFGILHRDLSPRPAYLALAAVGRYLADAKPLGKLRAADDIRAYLFRARPDGRERDVLVTWAPTNRAVLSLPATPLSVIDHLGRAKSNSAAPLNLSAAPLFAFFEPGTLHAELIPSPAAPALRTDKPSPIVLQAVIPPDQLNLAVSAYRISSDHPDTFSVFAYNFGAEKVSGSLKPVVPEGWTAELPYQIELQPGERKELPLKLSCQTGASAMFETVQINGDFGPAGQPILSFRLMPQPLKLRATESLPIAATDDPARWTPMISAASEMKTARGDSGGLIIKAKLGPGDRWVYPVTELRPNERPKPSFNYLMLTITVSEGSGTFRAIFDEENGSSYVSDLYPQPKPGQTIDVVAPLDTATFGTSWSPPDDNNQLDPAKIKRLKIGCNASTDTLTYTIKNLRWAR